MRTAEEVFHAAREVSKAQLPDGTYVPTSKLTAEQRAELRAEVNNAGRYGSGSQINRNRFPHRYLSGSRSIEEVVPDRVRSPFMPTSTHYGSFRGPSAGAPGGRGVYDAYSNWGVQPGIEAAVKEETRQSKVHPKVSYGSSVNPALEAKIDAALKADLVNSAKAPVVFHYGETMAQAIAAATPGNQMTGGKGRVILNADLIDEAGKINEFATQASLDDVINHEVAHTTPRGKNPMRFMDADGAIRHARALGEEGRADARGVRGEGLYRRNGLVLPDDSLDAARQQVRDYVQNQDWKAEGLTRAEAEAAIAESNKQIQAHDRYNRVHERVQQVYGTKDPLPAPAPVPTIEHPAPRPTPRPTPRGLPTWPKLPPLGTLASRRGMTTAAVLGGAGMVAGGAAMLANSHKTNRFKRPRDHDGDGKVFDGTRREQPVAKRIERDELGRFTAEAGAGVAGAGLASTVGSTVAAERMLRSHSAPVWQRGSKPSPEVLAAWDKRRRQTRLVRRAGTHGRNGMAAGLLAVGLGVALPRLEERAARNTVAKSRLPDGTWVPATEIPRKDRREYTERLARHQRIRAAGQRDPKAFQAMHQTADKLHQLNRQLKYGEGRDLTAAYRRHGVQPGMATVLTETLRPSARFGDKVRYGSSVTPGMEKAIEAGISERVVRSSPVPLAFHYGTTMYSAVAAAAPGHVTTGHIGRVIINTRVISPTGKFRTRSASTGSRITFADVINHEATHAALKNKNPQRHLHDAPFLSRRRNMGEEGRADAVAISGPGLYQRLGNALDRKGLARTEKAVEWVRPKKNRPELRQAVDVHRHYIQVHEKVQTAYGTRVEQPRDKQGRWRIAGSRRAKPATAVAKRRPRTALLDPPRLY